MWRTEEPAAQWDPNLQPAPAEGPPAEEERAHRQSRMLRFLRRHLFSFAVAFGISFALIYVETTTRLFFTLLPPRQRGDPCLTLIRATQGTDTRAVWANFGGCPGSSRDPAREIIEVDLRFGLLLYRKTEPLLADALPLPFTRVLRNRDHASRAFGRGGTHSYDMALVGDVSGIPWVDLIEAGGGRIHYRSTLTPGWFDSDVGGYFSDSTLHWTGQDWRLHREDDIQFVFPESLKAERLEQAALSAIQTEAGKMVLGIERDQAGAIQQMRAGKRTLRFEHDHLHRVTAISDGRGTSLVFAYDSAGCLARQSGMGEVFEYAYDTRHNDTCRLTEVKHQGAVVFRADYNEDDRLVQLVDPAGGVYTFSYTTDSRGAVVRADVVDPEGIPRRITMDKSSYWISRWGSFRGR